MDYEDVFNDISPLDPPKIPKNAEPEQVKNIWNDWLKKERKVKLAKKRKWERATIPQSAPNIQNGMPVKQNGVWKQQPMIAYTGSIENGSLELIGYEMPKQDRYYQTRGKRGGNKKSKAKRRKENKRQYILNKNKGIE